MSEEIQNEWHKWLTIPKGSRVWSYHPTHGRVWVNSHNQKSKPPYQIGARERLGVWMTIAWLAGNTGEPAHALKRKLDRLSAEERYALIDYLQRADAPQTAEVTHA